MLKTLQNFEGPSIDECNQILDEMQLIKMTNPLYIIAYSIFSESIQRAMDVVTS